MIKKGGYKDCSKISNRTFTGGLNMIQADNDGDIDVFFVERRMDETIQ
jgi:hypothetical protein